MAIQTAKAVSSKLGDAVIALKEYSARMSERSMRANSLLKPRRRRASFYSEMRRLREDLDYSPYAVLPERSLEAAIDLAESFIETMAAIIERERSG